MPRIKIIKAPKVPKAQFGLNNNMLSGLATIAENANKEDAKEGRLASQQNYNPFDIKWGQRQDPGVDITGEYSNKSFDQYATSSKDSKAFPTLSDTPMGGKGVLNVSQLTTPQQKKYVPPTFKIADEKKKNYDYAAIGNDFLNMGSALSSYVDNQKKKKQQEEMQANAILPDNFYAVNKGSDRGWYEKNDGMFDPYNTGYKGRREYGGMIKAAAGITVAGDYSVHPAFIPDAPNPYTFVSNNSVSETPPNTKSKPSSGANPMAEMTWKDYSKEFEGVSNLGIWGDKAHQATKSDHNTGDALDLGIKSLNQGSAISQKLMDEADSRNIKYIIFNNKIWNPSISNEWRPYNGKDPHTGHVHISFKRTAEAPNSENQISYSHNNPMNIHYGDFAAKYGAKPGANDSDGKVAIFPDFQTGLQANKDLLFGPNYNNLTIAEARNKWVSGNPNIPNSSTAEIVKAMGGNKPLSSLSPQEKDKLFKEFARWEGSQAYSAIKDMKLFNQGGQNNNNMKIRIVGVPGEKTQMAGGGQPPYSGQTDYGLYIGQRNLYKAMPKDPYMHTNESMSEEQESKDNPHVLEAEGGETIKRPDGSHMTIRGKRHTEGGVKLTKEQAPEGSFIFSDTRKMKIKDPETLKHFGKSGSKALTPAELAKQYDTNKYRGILADPNTDNLQKNTAKRMLDAYDQKLAELALVQESKKGFPQGIPDIAKPLMERMNAGKQQASQEEQNPEEEMQEQPPMQRYGGGLRKFQGSKGGSTVPSLPTYQPTFESILKNLQTQNYNVNRPLIDYNESMPKTQHSTIPGVYGVKNWTDASHMQDFKTRFPEFMSANPNWNPTKKGATANFQNWYTKNVDPTYFTGKPGETPYAADDKFGQHTWSAPGWGKMPPPPSTTTTMPPPGTTTTTTMPLPGTTTTTTIQPGDFDGDYGEIPYGWTQQDINNRNAAVANLAMMKPYYMNSRVIQPDLPEFVPVDWRGQAAAFQSAQNAASNQLGAYLPGQSMASNLSALAGQQAENLGKAISGVDQYNAQGQTAMNLQRSNMLNQFTQYNAGKKDYDMDYNNTADSRFRAGYSHGLDRLTAANNQGITNAGLLYDMNLSESPEYYISPRYQMRKFNSPQARYDFINRNRGGYQADDAASQSMAEKVLELKKRGISEENAMKILGIGAGTGKTTSTSNPYNPMRNKISTTMPNANAYSGAQPGQGGYGYDYSSAYPAG
jgi:hypothetical protein